MMFEVLALFLLGIGQYSWCKEGRNDNNNSNKKKKETLKMRS